MKSKRSRKVLKGEIKKKKKERNRMGGIAKCEAEPMFSKLRENWEVWIRFPATSETFK